MLTGWQQGRWATSLEADHANLITAINHLLAQPARVGEALQMIVHLDRFWSSRGHLAECVDLLRRGLDTAGGFSGEFWLRFRGSFGPSGVIAGAGFRVVAGPTC